MSEEDPATHTPWYDKRWLVVFAIFFAVVSMAVVGISAAAYFTWQASPEKALLDAIDYSAKTPATYQIDTGDISANASYDGSLTSVKGTYKSVKFDAIASDSTLYVKSSTPAELIAMFTPGDLPDQFKPLVDAIVNRVTDKWVSMPIDSLPKNKSFDTENTACVTLAKSQLQTNKDAKKELAPIYGDNKFLTFENTETTDKSKSYKVGIDDARFDAFMGAFQKSKFYASMKSQCSDLVKSIHDLKGSGATMDVTLSKAKNAMQAMTITGVGPSPVKIRSHYGDVGKINIPSDVISYDSISNSVIQTMIMRYLGNR